MKTRRMFSAEIVESDAFIELPSSAQNLYFHLGMRADDDGFVNPNITMRMIGANKDDLGVLLAKRFLLPFQTGVVVVKHWRMNNFIRKDRYKPTVYPELYAVLRVKENGAYSLDPKQGVPVVNAPWISDVDRRLTTGQPQVDQGKVRLGKVRIERSVEFLKKIPQEVLSQLSEKYKISEAGVKDKAHDLVLYCEQKGKKYKNYKSFLENAIKKDKNTLQNKFPYREKPQEPEPEEELTPEQKKRNGEMRAKIRDIAKGKKNG